MIVTLSNQYGCGATAIARRLAEELGYKYVDRQLPVIVAKRLRVPEQQVEASEEAGPTLGERLLKVLERGTPELASASTAPTLDEELLGAVQDAVRQYAARGNAVIVGRGAGVILGADPGVVRVFLHAPRDWRIERVMESARADRKTAEKELDRIDRARAAYLRDWYRLTFGDPQNYDLCIDASREGVAGCVCVIEAAVRARGA